jgi:hypothetical protein
MLAMVASFLAQLAELWHQVVTSGLAHVRPLTAGRHWHLHLRPQVDL